MLKPRPWWLFFIPSWFWVTISPCIYHPKGIDPASWPEVVAHERIHLRQQEGHLLRWLWCYVTSKAFRLEMEAEAIAAELAVIVTRPDACCPSLEDRAGALSSWEYLWAACSKQAARDAIYGALKKRVSA